MGFWDGDDSSIPDHSDTIAADLLAAQLTQLDVSIQVDSSRRGQVKQHLLECFPGVGDHELIETMYHSLQRTVRHTNRWDSKALEAVFQDETLRPFITQRFTVTKKNYDKLLGLPDLFAAVEPALTRVPSQHLSIRKKLLT